MQTTEAPEILIVEDNPIHATAMSDAITAASPRARLHVSNSGTDAFEFLHGDGCYVDSGERFRPALILLDLHMPYMDGHEFLTEIKRDEQLQQIPVLVVTNSEKDEDVNGCYREGASSYLMKPSTLDGFSELAGRLLSFWFETALLPRTR